MPNCDFGKPCDCSDCSMIRQDKIHKCSKCENIVYKIIDDLRVDRKGCGYYYYSYGLCEFHYNEYIDRKNKEEKLKQEYEIVGKNKYNEFLKKIQSIDIELIPIKILKTYKYKKNKYGSKYIIDLNLFNIIKIKNRWHINKNVIELFLQMNLDEYYSFDSKFIK